MNDIKEFYSDESFMGASCGKCTVTFVDMKAVKSVKLLDAELLFCPVCGTHVATALDAKTHEARKTA